MTSDAELRHEAARPTLGWAKTRMVWYLRARRVASHPRERKGFLTMRPCFSGIASAAQRGGISHVITADRIGQLG